MAERITPSTLLIGPDGRATKEFYRYLLSLENADLPLSLANGGTATAMTDPAADRLFGWNDPTGAGFVTVGAGLTFDGTTLAASGGGTWTLIGTLTTTTGTTQTQALGATYKEIRFQLSGVSGDNGTQTFRVAVSDDGTNYDTPQQITFAAGLAADICNGAGSILNTGVAATGKHVLPNTSTVNSIGTTFKGAYSTVGIQSSETGITTHVQFSPSAGNFDAGSISIFGLT